MLQRVKALLTAQERLDTEFETLTLEVEYTAHSLDH